MKNSLSFQIIIQFPNSSHDPESNAKKKKNSPLLPALSSEEAPEAMPSIAPALGLRYSSDDDNDDGDEVRLKSNNNAAAAPYFTPD